MSQMDVIAVRAFLTMDPSDSGEIRRKLLDAEAMRLEQAVQVVALGHQGLKAKNDLREAKKSLVSALKRRRAEMYLMAREQKAAGVKATEKEVEAAIDRDPSAASLSDEIDATETALQDKLADIELQRDLRKELRDSIADHARNLRALVGDNQIEKGWS